MTANARALSTLLLILLVSWSVPGLSVAAEVVPGQLALPDLAALERQASDTVSISLDASLLRTAAAFLNGEDPRDRQLGEIVAGLQGIYVRNFRFAHGFAYPASAVEAVRAQLREPCWQSIVNVRSAEEKSAVDIFICQIQQQARGLAIIAVEPRELTLVNIIGVIDMAKLRKLQGHFGIPPLPDEHR
jgi:hypothetical protein